MKAFFLAMIIIAPAAQAQSFYPLSAGQRFCELRQYGVDRHTAIQLAIRENWSDTRQHVPIMRNGKPMSVDALSMANYTVTYCPSLVQ